MGVTLVDIANESMDRYKRFLEGLRSVTLEYEKKEREIPVLRIGEYVISMHIDEAIPTRILGVSVNHHNDHFDIARFSEYIQDTYEVLERMTMAQFYAANRAAYRLESVLRSHDDQLSTLFRVITPYLMRPEHEGKAAIVEMNFELTPKGKVLLRQNRKAFAELAYGYILRTFVAETIGYLRGLPK